MSSSGQTQTGQPGPGINSMFFGSAPRSPAMVMERSWPPQTFMMRIFSGRFRAWISSSHCRALALMNANAAYDEYACANEGDDGRACGPHAGLTLQAEPPGAG